MIRKEGVTRHVILIRHGQVSSGVGIYAMCSSVCLVDSVYAPNALTDSLYTPLSS